MDEAAWKEHEALQENYWWHRHKREFLLHVAEQYPYRRVLEIGSCGGGLCAGLKKKCLAVPVDVSPRLAGRGGVAARLPRLSFKESSFDLVFLSEVLEHLDDPVEALKEVRRVMSPGGVCVITVPAWPGLWSGHDVFYGHKKRYTPVLLKSELSRAGLAIRRRGWLFFGPLLASFVRQAFIRFRSVGPSKSKFFDLPPFLNRICLAYLNVFERPFAFRCLLPLGLTCSVVSVKHSA